MRSPAIQNDFSYYRRTLNRRKMVHLWMNEYAVTATLCVCVCVCVCVCRAWVRGCSLQSNIICEMRNVILVLVLKTCRLLWLLHLLATGPCLYPQEDVSAGVNSSMSDLPDDIANKMSLFYANPTPMLNTLSGATEKFIQEVRSTAWLTTSLYSKTSLWRSPIGQNSVIVIKKYLQLLLRCRSLWSFAT